MSAEDRTEALRKLRTDWRPSPWLVDRVHLDFTLREGEATVRSRLALRRNPDAEAGPLQLDGKGLKTLGVWLDGRELGSDAYDLGEDSLTIEVPRDSAELVTEVIVQPEANTALEGLYRSSGTWCTQCEAEGFRCITWFPDRPDIMSRYTTTITAPRAVAPVLLSNGNRISSEELSDGLHRVTWEDPFPKPCYLFALVAGDLGCAADDFVTRSGRTVRLEVWTEHDQLDRTSHALGSLARAMKWDEETFGLEYDLDLYMIVAVRDFNMGAMENKGLNVFNSKYVLARPDTATDADYEHIEAVIAHEYFHNWTGNRVTCRDWFQLTLKEGLTVLRDQLFTADMTSEPVKRIGDVRGLRLAQFPEDDGPMAHPVRPDSYVEMNNFYTSTVYEKGAEVCRMVRTLLGPDGFRRGMDLYFQRHDGQAVRCEEWVGAMGDANGVDFQRFFHWYSQAGTPRVTVESQERSGDELHVTLSQANPKAEGAPPLVLPIRVGLLDAQGKSLPVTLGHESEAGPTDRLLVLQEARETWVFHGLPEDEVTISWLRGFSAPVRLDSGESEASLRHRFAHDPDPFARWDAGQEALRRWLLEADESLARGQELSVPDGLVEAFERVLADSELDGSMKALALAVPSVRELLPTLEEANPERLHEARNTLRREIGQRLFSHFVRVHEETRPGSGYRYENDEVARRQLHVSSLAWMMAAGEDTGVTAAERLFDAADNMTDSAAALVLLADRGGPVAARVISAFEAKWSEDPLVMDKWFQAQALASHDEAFEGILKLADHPNFTWDNPNRVRSLVAAFAAANLRHFHRSDGRGYRFLADAVLKLQAKNPQIAARLAGTLNGWRRLEPGRAAMIKAELDRIAAQEQLSKDVLEIVTAARGSE